MLPVKAELLHTKIKHLGTAQSQEFLKAGRESEFSPEARKAGKEILGDILLVSLVSTDD